jgi:hypothetical protein
MKKLIATLICLMPLAGCWWDSAPETYKGTAEIKFDNGQTVTRDFQCDFRAQQATRMCSFIVPLPFEQWVEFRPIILPGDGKTILLSKNNWDEYNKQDVRNKLRKKFGTDLAKKNLKTIFSSSFSFTITAHARKEDRYLVEALGGEGFWYDEKPTAQSEDRRHSYFVVDAEQLEDGWKMGYSEHFDKLLLWKKSSVARGYWDFWEPIYSGPQKAQVLLKWEPVPANSLS